MPGKRILWWCNAFDPPSGGAELWAQQVVRRFHARGHVQHVIAVTDGSGTVAQTLLDGVPIATIPAAERLSDAPALAAAIGRICDLLAESRPEVVLVNNFGHAALALLGLVRSRIAAPVLLIAHNVWLEEAAVPGSPLDLAVRRTAAIMTFEPHIADWLRGHWPEAPIACIDHAIPVDTTPVVPLPENPRLLFCGRLSEEKGPLALIEAMAELAGSHPTARLTIAGSGGQRAEIEARIAALGLSGSVCLLGGIAPERVAAVIDEAFAVCVPSTMEGFGLTALEAAWRGRPVVASRVGGLPGLIADGETGLLVPPADPLALAQALAQLLDDPERAQEMGRNARARAEARPGWDEHVTRVEAIVETVIQQRGCSDAHITLG